MGNVQPMTSREAGSRPGAGPTPQPSATGIWVVLAAITMSFAAFTSALLVRQGSSTDWQHFALPGIVYLNTLVMLASSVTLEVARRRAGRLMRDSGTPMAVPLAWLWGTLGLGAVFLAGQAAAWLQLRARGVYLPTSPSSSFFYVFTAVHGLYLLGGMGGLMGVVFRLKRRVLRRSTLEASSHYWHFMDILWLYLLLIFWMKV